MLLCAPGALEHLHAGTSLWALGMRPEVGAASTAITSTPPPDEQPPRRLTGRREAAERPPSPGKAERTRGRKYSPVTR
eukprot:CAMPEP_0119060192 /NCGR_PEP_ID=MMETSP1178-20130426/4199_1 /TAXON_ID=33656 /ORGANISM="unid sp, Strain CCMP2000" /LENGTH=77 /DNA_ID=CAMNT_0007041275 /DNA_START=349 /DNA_END=578 /DNA_ORIENTATION=+